MQDIFIDKVHLENVRNHDEMEMDFPPNNFTAIVGKNGAGKSTIFKSISMALYGDDGGKKGERLSIADMLPEKNPKNLAIIVDFRIVENNVTDNYQVQLYQNHKKYRNGFFLIKNGTDISGATKTDTYEMIEKLLYPRDVYHNTVYFTQQVKDFFTALTNSDQKDIFDSILSSKIYDDYYKATSDVLAQKTDKLAELSLEEQSYISRCEFTKKHIAEMNELIENQKLDNKTSILETENKIIQLQNEIANRNAEINELSIYSDLSSQVKRKLVEAKSKIDLINKSIDDAIQKAKTDLEKYIKDKLQKEVDSCKVKISQIRSSYDAKKAGFLDASNKLQAECAAKVEELSNKVRATFASIQSIKTALQEKLNSINSGIRELRVKYNTTQKEDNLKTIQALFDTAIRDLDHEINICDSHIIEYQNQIRNWINEINQDKEALNAPVSICSKCHQPLKDQSAIDAIQTNIRHYQVKIDTAKNQIVEYTSKRDNLQNQKSDKLNAKTLEIQKVQKEIDDIIKERDLEEKKLIDLEHLIKTESENEEKKYIAEQQRLNSQIADTKFNYDCKLNYVKQQILELDSQQNAELGQIKVAFEKFKSDAQQEYATKQSTVESEVKQQYQSQIAELIQQVQQNSNLDQQYDIYISKLQNAKILLSNAEVALKAEIEKSKQLSNWESPLVITVSHLNKELLDLQDKLSTISSSTEAVRKEHTMLSFWKQAFSDTGIKSMLIDMAIPYMNESVAEYLDIVAPGIFTVSFDTLSSTKSGQLRDKFSVNVRHNIKGTSSHKKLSGGEKRLVDIACMCALRGLAEKLYGKRIHNIFYDEVLDALDEDVSYIFCQVSKKMTSDRNITIITHKLADNVEIDRCFKL